MDEQAKPTESFNKNGRMDLHFVKYDFDFSEKQKNPHYIPPQLDDDAEWLKDIYRNILLMYVKDSDYGLLYWIKELKDKKRTREQVYQYFVQIALQDNQKNSKVDFGDVFDKNGRKRALLVIKQSMGDCFMITALFKSLKEQYPDHDLYIGVEPDYAEIFMGNPYVHKILPYHVIMENELAMIGYGNSPKYVDVYFNPAIGSQQRLNYLSNNNIALNLTDATS
jgi:hypothetical protein